MHFYHFVQELHTVHANHKLITLIHCKTHHDECPLGSIIRSDYPPDKERDKKMENKLDTKASDRCSLIKRFTKKNVPH